MMDQTTVTLIVGLVTVAMSGVVSSIVTFRLGKSKEQQAFMRAKAEQLYLATDEYGKAFSGLFIGHLQLMNGRIDYNQMLDMQIADGQKDRKYGGAETMTMLVEIYFPNARAALAQVWKTRDTISTVTAQIKRYYQEAGDASDPELKARFVTAVGAVDQAIKALQIEIIRAARHHAGEREGLPFWRRIISKLHYPILRKK
ncbi:MAG: hypothetical protein JWR00_330 [Rubritepida sp.]|nr:hypothetical protein [Rubritepida sp.]